VAIPLPVAEQVKTAVSPTLGDGLEEAIPEQKKDRSGGLVGLVGGEVG
jgi:hypothetical protein